MTNLANKKILYSSDNCREDEIMLQPYNYVVSSITYENNEFIFLWRALNHWFKLSDEKFDELIKLIEVFYNYFLVLDDIMDNSDQRRGIPAPHVVFGIDRTLAAVHYSHNIFFKNILKLERPEAVDIFIKGGLESCKGGGMEIYWRDNGICPTEEEYIQMIYYKTSGHINFGVRMFQLFSNNKANYDRIIGLLGAYSQIFNDYINLRCEKYMKLRSYYADITEGKFTLPIVYAIRSHPEDDQIMNIIKQKTSDENTQKYCVSLIEKYGGFEKTKQKLGEFRTKIIEQINMLGENPKLVHIVDYLYKNIDDDIEEKYLL